jgi:hypothetical protein
VNGRQLHIGLSSLPSRIAAVCSKAVPGGLRPLRKLPACLLVITCLYASDMERTYASTGEELLPQGTQGQVATAPGYAWSAPVVGSTNSLGSISVAGGHQGPTAALLTPSIHARGGNLVCEAARLSHSGKQLSITYVMGKMLLQVTVAIEVSGATLQATMDADQPVITSLDLGPWAPALRAQPIAVPYYTGDLWYLPEFTAYANAWWDWKTTHATALQGTTALYLPRTDSTLSALHERFTLIVSPDVESALPSPGNAPSPFMAVLSGRLVLDIWEQDFKRIEHGFVELGDYGINSCVGIIHIWQHAGYDNALPQHYPANEALGGDAGLLPAMNAGKADGCLMALHENYIDYYPNYPKFDPAAVALNTDGKRMPSWLNQTTGIQSYSVKPAWMVTNASTQSPEIHRRYGTTASYLDVNSGVSPSTHGDMDATAPGSGMLAARLAGDAALWSYERKTHGGPVLGEGRDHWFYSGMLDGVEAQFGAGSVPALPGSHAPLFVDFDLEKIHPLQVNHGMGYYERWVAPGEVISNTFTMDAYRMQEIAFGHAPFLGHWYWNDLGRAFVESNLVTPVAENYGTALVSSIAYQVNGAWVSPDLAARSRAFDRVQVTYKNGLTVVANARPEPMQWHGRILPQYGWVAIGKLLQAYTAMCDETVCDYAETPTSIFANARSQTDARMTETYATPSITSGKQASGGSFVITSEWRVNRKMDNDYKVFLHFVDASKLKTNTGIAFQGGAALASPTSQWAPGKVVTVGPMTVQIPASVPSGTYSIRIGLYDPNTGDRVPLSGSDDGGRRYIVGTLRVNGGTISVNANPLFLKDPRMNSAGSVVNFVTVQTDGMVSIRMDDQQWTLRPFPRSRSFTVLLQKSKFLMPATVYAEGTDGSTRMITPIAEGAYWKLPLTGAKSYTWPAAQKAEHKQQSPQEQVTRKSGLGA